MALKKYSKREPIAFIWIMVPYVPVINSIIFGNCIFTTWQRFLLQFSLSALYLFFAYYLFRTVSYLIRKRFPDNSDLFRRIGLMLPIFYLMNVLMVTGMYSYFNTLAVNVCEPRTSMFWWAVLFGCITSTILTFINEAVANWHSWKISVTETEQLKNVYQKTKLLGLKGQVNPHFLFNCFNSLSSLISEDETEAEKFLNEMTKVHRYMLRGDDELLVTLEEELKFVTSYLYLIRARFGNAIYASIEVRAEDKHMLLPPLSLQAILENTIYTNSTSAADPLKIRIGSGGSHTLVIENSVHRKIRRDNIDYEEGLDNLIDKYKLLNEPKIMIEESDAERKIIIPLIESKETFV
ncbi:sensor histidine kinase [Flavihumibacter solisilvae]|uniref:sensor histidine kinase n=1 Tax=Flavihumibacter solisilvae TaxID=1349421 RepID=UPI00068A7562|nr:histidine kinase [Flavihumibacter solisilvae]